MDGVGSRAEQARAACAGNVPRHAFARDRRGDDRAVCVLSAVRCIASCLQDLSSATADLHKNGVVTSSPLEAYPNPVQGTLTVRTQLGSTAPVQVTMLDLLGKVVLRAAPVSAGQMQQSGVELNTNRLASGVYVVRVTTSEGTYSTKVSVQH